MTDLLSTTNQIEFATSFQELVSSTFYDHVNAKCWKRSLKGDFSEIVNQVKLTENMTVLKKEQLLELKLSEEGDLAREILLDDFKLLKEHGASPTLNVISSYERDDSYPLFPTDVYSFHVDRSPVPTDTFLCTYYGESSEIIPNAEATQKILIPRFRTELSKLYDGPKAGFEDFLSEYFFDLHYQANPKALPISLGHAHLWKLAVDHPKSKALPCIHRAPIEKDGLKRLLMIC